MRRILLFVSFFLCGLYVALNGPAWTSFTLLAPESSPQPNSRASHAGAPGSDQVTPGSVLSVPSEQMRKALRDMYRLRPDKRILLAVAEIHQLLSHHNSQDAVATYETNRWIIRYGGEEVGALPELPDFSDAIQLLMQWGQRIEDRFPLCLTHSKSGKALHATLIEKQSRCAASRSPHTTAPDPKQLTEIHRRLDQFLAPETAQATRQVDALWRSGARNDSLLKDATRGLVNLTLQVLDQTETADRLPARAVAMLALSKGLTQLDMAQEESLLANSMGYTAHAERIAIALPKTDPIRLFVTREDRALVRVAQADHATVHTRYLALLRIASLQNPESLNDWVAAYFSSDWWSPPIFKAGLELEDFSANHSLSEFLPRVVILALAQEVGMPHLTDLANQVRSRPLTDEQIRTVLATWEAIMRTDSSTLVGNFESGLPLLDRRYEGPFLDASIYKTYFRAHFFSGLYVLGLHYLDSLSSDSAADQFARTLGQASGGTSLEFRSWYQTLVDSRLGKANVADLVANLDRFPNLGGPPIMRTFEEQEQRFQYADRIVLDAMKKLVGRLDTRPRHRLDFGEAARKHLLDAAMGEKLLRSASAVDPVNNPYLQAWIADYSGDHARLLALAHSPAVPLITRAAILKDFVGTESANPDIVRGEYRHLIEEDPWNWNIRSYYVQYLKITKDYKTAKAVIKDWLKVKDESAGFDYIYARTVLAELYYLEGQYQQGLQAVESVVESQQNGAMIQAAVLLEKLGRTQEAERLTRLAVQRYPDTIMARLQLAAILWAQRKHDAAATALLTGPYPISVDDWQWEIGKRFVEVFGNNDQEALRAFAALKANMKDPSTILPLAMAFEKAGNHELAFAMASQITSQSLDIKMRAYGYLKAARGKNAAIDWLRQSVPHEKVTEAAYLAFENDDYEVLWEFVQDPSATDPSGFLWLLRAAVSLKLGQHQTPRKEELVTHYQKADPQQHYHLIGRYLLGLASERDVLPLATDAAHRCQIAFFLGWKAHAEGRYEEASDWYRIAVETASRTNWEYNWAYRILKVWNNHAKSLARLAAQKL